MRLQFAPLSGSQSYSRSQRHNHMTLLDLVKSTYRQSTSWGKVQKAWKSNARTKLALIEREVEWVVGPLNAYFLHACDDFVRDFLSDS